MAAIFSAWRTRLAERRVRAESTLPPLILVPGHKLSQEQKCLTLSKRLKSGPISESTVSTEVTASPAAARTASADGPSAVLALVGGRKPSSTP